MVNLRHAQVKAVAALDSTKNSLDSETFEDDEEEGQELNKKRKHHDIDKLVHEVAKLFGHVGTPEYCHGAVVFRVFLSMKARECTGINQKYYESAQNVFLKRQVGSRYYVTSYNAGCIYFLCTAMVAFLNEQQLIKSLNLLELSCLEKLQDPVLIANLRLEGLLFDKVYSDLMTLVKSKVLNKSTLDMNVHYEELLAFLVLLTSEPKVLLDSEVRVFKSEPQLYSLSSSSKTNHRLNKKYIPVRKSLHEDLDDSIILPMICAAANAMSLKLQSYKVDHLPGGQYHNPSSEVHSVLSTIQPHNDRSESVFGCNDWLTKILPNMAQSTRSAMIEVSCNKTIDWLNARSDDEKDAILTLAQSQRESIQKETEKEKHLLLEQKIAERQNTIKKAVEKQTKHYDKIENLKTDPLITSIDALNERVTMIKSLLIPESIKETEIKMLVKRQVQLRTQVFQAKGAKIVFTEKGKQKSSSELLHELSSIIVNASVSVRRLDETVTNEKQPLYVVFDKPSLLIGVTVRHRFQDTDGTLQWYDGVITLYRRHTFTIYYDETKENCLFSVDDLKQDFSLGDLWFQ